MNSVRLVRLESKIIKSKIYMSFLRSIMFVGTCSDAGKSLSLIHISEPTRH